MDIRHMTADEAITYIFGYILLKMYRNGYLFSCDRTRDLLDQITANVHHMYGKIGTLDYFDSNMDRYIKTKSSAELGDQALILDSAFMLIDYPFRDGESHERY